MGKHRHYRVESRKVAGGIISDYSNAPCFICKPKTLGECGHDVRFVCDRWLGALSNRQAREAGRRLAAQYNRMMMEKVLAALNS